MSDLLLTYSEEFMLTLVEGASEVGIEFVDAWNESEQGELIVVDAGRIVVKDAESLERSAARWGLNITKQRSSA